MLGSAAGPGGRAALRSAAGPGGRAALGGRQAAVLALAAQRSAAAPSAQLGPSAVTRATATTLAIAIAASPSPRWDMPGSGKQRSLGMCGRSRGQRSQIFGGSGGSAPQVLYRISMLRVPPIQDTKIDIQC